MGDAQINRRQWLLVSLFLLICLGFCGVLFYPVRSVSDIAEHRDSAASIPAVEHHTNSVRNALLRIPFSAQANRPVALVEGCFAFTREGRCQRFSDAGQSLWQVALSNQQWQAARLISGDRVVLVSQQGGICALDATRGAVLWSVQTEGYFTQPPLFETGTETVKLWVISQDDGRIFCLRAEDGGVMWTSTPTNRSDGEPAQVGPWLVYGNCDGALHLFQSADGAHVASIPVGENDQMAGGICVMKRGLIVTGTRSGLLIVADPQARAVRARAQLEASETFATPLEYAPDRLAMATPDGRLTFWKYTESSLVADGVVTVGSLINDVVQTSRALWCLADQGLVRVDATSREQTHYALGDACSGLIAVRGYEGVACMVDGDLVIVKGDAK